MNTSLSDCDFGELVWENGQILTRVLSCAGSHESHRWTGFSLHGAEAQLKVVGRETSMEKRGQLWDSEFPGHAKMDSLKKDYYTELLSEFPGSILNNEVAYASNSHDEQLVPSAEDDHLNFRQGNACYLPRGEPQVTGPKGDQIWRSSLQKWQASAPYMESWEGSGKILVSTSGLPSSKMQQPEQDQNGEPDNGIGPMNFSYFSKLAALDKSKTQIMDASGATTKPGLSRVENSKSTDYPDGANPFELSPIGPPNLKPFQQPVASNPVGQEVPFVRSSAAADYQVHEPNLSYAASMVKGKQRKPHGDEESDEPVVPSSSTSSREASNYPSYSFRSKYQESEESEHPSQSFEDEPRRSAGGRSAGFKRHRSAEVHSLSEKRRRDKINKKMRLLQELVPNCKKGDKISILDEAIDYLKILQLQVQIMSMGSGLCMPPVMTPAALQHMPHFSPMGMGMGMGMGVRMGMGMGMGMGLGLGMGCRPEQFPSPHILRAGALSGIAGTALSAHQMLGHPGQVLPMSVSSAPFVPLHAGSLTQSVLVPSLPNDIHKVEDSSSSPLH